MAGSKTRPPFAIGLKKDNEALNIEGLRTYFSEQLIKKKISTFEEWSSKTRGIQIYNVSTPTIRFALLSAYHKTVLIDKNTGEISKSNAKLTDSNNLLNLNSWHSSRYKTVEHIAPKNAKDSNSWSQDIYSDGDVIPNSLGNLTLLPQAENEAIGNNPWAIKKVYLSCFTAPSANDVDTQINIMKKSGLNIRKPVIKLMKENYALGLLVSSLLEISEWNRNSIITRHNYLAKIIWADSCEHLPLKPIT
ncbi:MAG: HNH endonuclease [Gammaproteobacteria bacterium]|nr:HNH endonuclease [Gammaproteobacteria bacterium]